MVVLYNTYLQLASLGGEFVTGCRCVRALSTLSMFGVVALFDQQPDGLAQERITVPGSSFLFSSPWKLTHSSRFADQYR